MTPDDDDEIPDTEPAPVVLEVPRVPSLPWGEEQVTAVECPHPPGLDGAPRVG
jgi:hypothetical protein